MRRDPQIQVVVTDASEAVKGRILPFARSEALHLHDTLSHSKDLQVISIQGEDDRSRFIKEVRSAGIVHFCGHGEYNNKKPNKSGLVFVEGKMRGEDIPATLKGSTIIFSNACESGVSIQSGNSGRGWTGLAAAFIEAGAINYVGSL